MLGVKRRRAIQTFTQKGLVAFADFEFSAHFKDSPKTSPSL